MAATSPPIREGWHWQRKEKDKAWKWGEGRQWPADGQRHSSSSREWRDSGPLNVCAWSTRVVFWLCKRLRQISVHVMCVHVCVLYTQFSYVDKTLSLDATAPRTSQCAVEDMWSKLNPLLYFTSSFTTQIQTSFSAWALDTNALCTGIRQVPAPFFFLFFPLTYFL